MRAQVTSILLVLLLLPLTSSLFQLFKVFRPSALPKHNLFRARWLATSLAVPLFVLAPSCLAAPPSPLALRFAGTYDDLLHPLCVRRIEVSKGDIDAKSLANKRQPPSAYLARFTGTDVGPAGLGDKIMISCDEETLKKYPVREFEFDARISVDGREVDAGDDVHVGFYQSIREGDSFEGIRWKDGNRWIKKDE